MAIDWNFLQSVEGKENTTYVPQKNGKAIQESGVTIGTGVDLGAQSRAKFEKLGISEDIIKKLEPFFKKKKDKALKALEEEGPVTLEDEEVFAIDEALKKDTLKRVKSWYNKDNKLGQDWSDLSDRQQTVVLSTFYNHGLDGAPNFKKQVETGDWTGAIENLRNFYPSKDNELHERRVKEAQYLAGLPPEQIDGIDGDITAEAVEKFKNTVGVSTPDQVRPEQPDIGSLEYFDNMMAMVRERQGSSQRGSQTPSEPRMEPEPEPEEPEQEFTEAEESLIESAVGYSPEASADEAGEEPEFTPAEQMLIERASGGRKKEEPAEEREPQREQRATGTRETEEPVRAETTGGQDDGRDPIFGIF